MSIWASRTYFFVSTENWEHSRYCRENIYECYSSGTTLHLCKSHAPLITRASTQKNLKCFLKIINVSHLRELYHCDKWRPGLTNGPQARNLPSFLSVRELACRLKFVSEALNPRSPSMTQVDSKLLLKFRIFAENWAFLGNVRSTTVWTRSTLNSRTRTVNSTNSCDSKSQNFYFL